METQARKKRSPFVITLFGPPGSGKGTQAGHIEKRFGAVHIDTGRLIEKIVYDPRFMDDPVIQRERKNFDRGILNTPEWVCEIIQNEIKKRASEGESIVFSGSPRTLFEAECLMPVLGRLYKKNRMMIFRLNVSPKISLFRNSHRTVCSRCGMPQIYQRKSVTQCRECGGDLVTRSLDAPEAIRVRLREYEERTRPIYSYFEKHGYEIFDINGERDPETVSQGVSVQIKARLA